MADPEQRLNAVSLLPLELQVMIFNNLSTKEKGRCALVCKEWRDAIYVPKIWRDVRFTMKKKMTFKSQDKHRLCESLAARNIREVELLAYKDHSCSHKKCYKLRFFTSIVKNLGELVYLNLGEIEKPDLALVLISRYLGKLVHLEIGGLSTVTALGVTYLTGQTLEDSPKHPQLLYLKLSQCNDLTDISFSHLGMGQPRLKHLFLNNCRQMTDAGLKFLMTLTGLEELGLTDDRAGADYPGVNTPDMLSDTALALLTALPNLQVLHLSEYDWFTSTGHRFLPDIVSLRKLVVSNWTCNTTGRSYWQSISAIPNLRELTINGYGITKDVLDILCHSKSRIAVLKISLLFTIVDHGLASISRLSELQELHLASCPGIIGLGFGYLANANSKLSVLDLSGCENLFLPLTINSILTMTNLRRLVWPPHIRVSKEQSARLASILPELLAT